MRKETTSNVVPEGNISENNGDGSLSEDTNNAVGNSNRDRAGSFTEDTCSTAVLMNEGQETDLNEDTRTVGHKSKRDGSLNGDTNMNSADESEDDESLGSVKQDTCSTAVFGKKGEETDLNEDTGTVGQSEGENSRKEDTKTTVTNINRDSAGSVQEDTCSSAVSGNKGEETDLNDDTGTGGDESGGEHSRKGDTNNTVTNRNRDIAGSVEEDTCSSAVSRNKGEETDFNDDTGTGGHQSGGEDSRKEDTNNTVTNRNRDRAGSVKEDTCSTAVCGKKGEQTDLNENTGTGGDQNKGDGSLTGIQK